jgi:HPt (histidine-containing phosphotransfer) domain-containing protein
VKTAADSLTGADPAVAALLPAYLERRAVDARALEAALAASDYTAIAAIGHRLKGLGSTYGHDAISQAGRSLEEAARAEDAGAVQQLITTYKRTLAELN